MTPTIPERKNPTHNRMIGQHRHLTKRGKLFRRMKRGVRQHSMSPACRRSSRLVPAPTFRRSCKPECRRRCVMRRFVAPGPLIRRSETSWGSTRTSGTPPGRTEYRVLASSIPASTSSAWSRSCSEKRRRTNLSRNSACFATRRHNPTKISEPPEDRGKTAAFDVSAKCAATKR